MAETSHTAAKRCAVVTGANKGIGMEICRQLASNGVLVVLTARDEKRGHEAVENLRASGLSDVVFHQLDLMSTTSVVSLADFIKAQFGKLDILVNNAAIGGVIINLDTSRTESYEQSKIMQSLIQTYELAEECMKTNYYGTKGVTEALLPLLQLSSSPRIVNISSRMGVLKNIFNRRAKEILSDVDSLTEEKIDKVLNGFLKDFREGMLENNSWPTALSAYTVSKAAVNAYTRVLAKKFPTISINSVCPGYVKTDLNANMGILSVKEGAEGPVKLALMPDGGSSGLFFANNEVIAF